MRHSASATPIIILVLYDRKVIFGGHAHLFQDILQITRNLNEISFELPNSLSLRHRRTHLFAYQSASILTHWQSPTRDYFSSSGKIANSPLEKIFFDADFADFGVFAMILMTRMTMRPPLPWGCSRWRRQRCESCESGAAQARSGGRWNAIHCSKGGIHQKLVHENTQFRLIRQNALSKLLF